MQYIYKYQSPIGGITLAGNGDCLTGLWFDGQKYFAATLSEENEEKSLPIFEQTKEWLDCYFSGRNPDFTPSLHLEGTPFRLAVWEILRKIPYGEVITYKDIADEIARQKAYKICLHKLLEVQWDIILLVLLYLVTELLDAMAA